MAPRYVAASGAETADVLQRSPPLRLPRNAQLRIHGFTYQLGDGDVPRRCHSSQVLELLLGELDLDPLHAIMIARCGVMMYRNILAHRGLAGTKPLGRLAGTPGRVNHLRRVGRASHRRTAT